MEVAQVCHKASFASQSILPRRIEKGCVQSVRVKGPPGGTLQTMIGEMAISTARKRENDPKQRSCQSRESQSEWLGKRKDAAPAHIEGVGRIKSTGTARIRTYYIPTQLWCLVRYPKSS